MTVDTIKTIAVIGAGTMGQGIAQVAALGGYKVLLYDITSELIDRGISSINKNLEVAAEKGKVTVDQHNGALKSIYPITNFEQVQADLIIEAVIEKLEVKQQTFAALERINSRESILVTNTSSIPVTQIASALQHADRFAGLHFFNPVPAMKLVEVIKGSATSDDTINLLLEFSRSLSKQPVLVHDSPGFIVNRVARHFYVESLKILEENVADVKSIDLLMKSAGFKMGPFELMDLIGVDVNLSVTTSMFHAFNQESKFRPSRIQQQKVNAGHLGRKSGKGFYEY
jgi:3-hydroxybutyryl-CoA dehydrogenase